MQVFGNDHPTPDGSSVRDYIDVMDLTQTHILALEFGTQHCGIPAINLGTGRGYSVLELVHAFERASRSQRALRDRGPARRGCSGGALGLAAAG